jgi:glutamine amidotransferase
MKPIIIIDYGIGNLGSILNMFKRVGAKAIISSDLQQIKDAEKILLPGVGAFDTAMQRIMDMNLLNILNQKAHQDKIPILGICLGMQLLTEGSEEGKLPGLGWIPAKTHAFKSRIPDQLKIPHMGWNLVKQSNKSLLTEKFDLDTSFYFVHSYYVKCMNQENSILKTMYGIEFDSAIQKDNIIGAQFHPEKSHKFGMKLFDNFNKLF